MSKTKNEKMRVKPQEFTHPDLTNAIAKLCNDNGPENAAELSSLIRKMISKDTEILYTARQTEDGKTTACTVTLNDGVFLTAFSEAKYVGKEPGIIVLVAPLGKLLESVCAENGPKGIVFNPFSKECHCALTKDLIGKIIRAEI